MTVTSSMPGTCSPPRTTRAAWEYRITDWLWKNMPDARIAPSGSVRFWFDAWHDLSQLGGGSEQGLLNKQVEPAQWEANLGHDGEPTVLWMQCLGVDAIFVSDKRSQEFFKDFEHPEKIAGLLPVLYDDGQGKLSIACSGAIPPACAWWIPRSSRSSNPQRGNDDVEYV